MKRFIFFAAFIFLFFNCSKDDGINEDLTADLSGVWSVIDSSESVPLGGIWGETDCLYAVGGSLAVDPTIHLGTILKNIDGEWIVDKNDWDSRLVLKDIVGKSCNEIYIVGQFADGNPLPGVLLKYDGSKWTQERYENIFHKIKIIDSEIYITASNGLFKLENDSFNKILDFEFHGTDIWGTKSNNLYLTGYSGEDDYILHYKGKEWVNMLDSNSFSGNFIEEIVGISENEIYAVGTGGNILKYNGKNWEYLKRGFNPIYGLEIFNSEELYFVTGLYWGIGEIYKYDIDSDKFEMVLEIDSPFYGIWGDKNLGIYASTGDGRIIQNEIK
tara:strand:+ start:417 stop:1403 length:987 start_codon:yes stop_codon:yes gene_type:complete